MCGIFGVISSKDRPELGAIVASALNQMQNRGDYSAGVATIRKLKFSRKEYRRLRAIAVSHTLEDFNPFEVVRGVGKVSDVFKDKEAEAQKLKGFMGIGQVRYPTAGYTFLQEAEQLCEAEKEKMKVESIQPLIAPFYKVSMVHNGDVHNFKEIIEQFASQGLRQATNNDLEAILKVFNQEFFGQPENTEVVERVGKSVKGVLERVKGTYSVLTMVNNVGLVAFRDPRGRRPLFFGVNKEGDKVIDYAFSSETVALEKMLFKGTKEKKYVTGKSAYDEVKPGELILITKDFEMHRRQIVEPQLFFCPFEASYFMRASSFINDKRVKTIRRELLDLMWKRFEAERPEKYQHLIENKDKVVIAPVPRTAESAAIELANKSRALGFSYENAIEKNPFSSRIFMQPTQKHRDLQTIDEHYIYEEDVKDKIVIVVDDSIVRGTTLKHDVKYFRDIGASQVHLFITFPEIRNPCMHAIDFHTNKELFAYGKSLEQMKQELGLRENESLVYTRPEELSKAIGLEKQNLCDECYKIM
ncbi:hypothetical protein JXB28_03705 [Candidatus Woesearchaeota archaeon]|nr:hypothetical protein [Candidatus Woesearchaeota archaeon]